MRKMKCVDCCVNYPTLLGCPSFSEVIEDNEDSLYNSGIYSMVLVPIDLQHMFESFLEFTGLAKKMHSNL